jgi:hypothetical protein
VYLSKAQGTSKQPRPKGQTPDAVEGDRALKISLFVLLPSLLAKFLCLGFIGCSGLDFV